MPLLRYSARPSFIPLRATGRDRTRNPFGYGSIIGACANCRLIMRSSRHSI